MRPILAVLCIWLVSATGLAQTYPTPAGYPTPPPPPPPPVAPERTTALLHMLDAHLGMLAAQSQGRVLDGSLQLVAGAAFVGVGFAVDDAMFRALLWTTGGVALTRGVNQLTVTPDASDEFMAFQRMPVLSLGDARSKLRFGEAALVGLARRARAARLIDGSLAMAGAAGYVPLYWAMRRDDDPDYRFGDDAIDYLGLTLSAVGFAAGVVTMVLKSSAERRARAYREAKERFVAESPGEFAHLPDVHVALSAHGARAALVMRF